MKRTTIVSIVAVALVLATVVVVRAEIRERHGWCQHGWAHPGPLSYVAHELKLSDSQRAQIQTLWNAERPTLSAHIRELLAEHKEMTAIAANNSPDPAEVQRITDHEATTIATLMMEKEARRSKIYRTGLTPEQRIKADELQKQWESRLQSFADRLGAEPTAKH